MLLTVILQLSLRADDLPLPFPYFIRERHHFIIYQDPDRLLVDRFDSVTFQYQHGCLEASKMKFYLRSRQSPTSEPMPDFYARQPEALFESIFKERAAHDAEHGSKN